MRTGGLLCPTEEPTGTDFLSSITLPFHIQSEISASQFFLLATCFLAVFLLGLFFYPEDGGGMFLRNVG
jgi:hypothetical protein